MYNNVMDYFEENKGFDVYIKIDNYNNVIDVGSNVFIKDFRDWILIDTNVMGDKGAHAQTQYLSKPLTNNLGEYNYFYKNGIIEDRGI